MQARNEDRGQGDVHISTDFATTIASFNTHINDGNGTGKNSFSRSGITRQ